jgi:hypothetical protein
MRRILLVFLVVSGAAACAGRATPTTLTARTYTCGEHQIETGREALRVAGNALPIGWSDDDGLHYVAWPTGKTTRETIEYMIPADARMDAVELRYDTTKGSSRVDWRLVGRKLCTANGGYNDALARFATGKSFDQVAQELALSDRAEARQLVHHALQSLTKRYYKDR